jgi:hypothetical protein
MSQSVLLANRMVMPGAMVSSHGYSHWVRRRD